MMTTIIKLVTLILLTFHLAFQAEAQKTAMVYRCLPCGGACDNEEHQAAGKCAHCGMKLVLASTINFAEVAPAEVCNYIANHPGALLLDVRTKEEFDGKANPNFGTLKGAINIPIQDFSQRLGELNAYKSKEILVFCSHSHRSPQAAYLLNQKGFTHVTNMAGGMSTVTDNACKN